MEWFDEHQILVTCAKDKSVKFWRFPPLWIDDGDLKSHVPAPISQEKLQSAQSDSVEQRPARQYDSDEDDLTGWNN
jgi:hypothetical protein